MPGARLRYFGSDQPRYVVEAVIPWTALAVDDDVRRLEVEVHDARDGRHLGTIGMW